jgi:hypothetical protein
LCHVNFRKWTHRRLGFCQQAKILVGMSHQTASDAWISVSIKNVSDERKENLDLPLFTSKSVIVRCLSRDFPAALRNSTSLSFFKVPEPVRTRTPNTKDRDLRLVQVQEQLAWHIAPRGNSVLNVKIRKNTRQDYFPSNIGHCVDDTRAA